MLKVRVVPTLLFKEHGLVKGVGFDSWRRVGTALPQMRVYETREVDELILVDITATAQSRLLDVEEIDRLADECSMPLTVGGGIRDVDHIRRVLRAGADKVCINTAAVEAPEVIERGAAAFGSQCIVVSIDFARRADGSYEARTRSGRGPTGIDPVALARRMEERGAGELLVTSVDRDGTMAGYDLEMLRRITDAVRIPVIAAGGAGTYEHLCEAVTVAGVSAVAAASMFHFTERTPMEAKRYMAERGIPMRL